MNKWDGNQIISFSNIYQKYEILWNIKLQYKEQMNTLKRGSAFEKLLKELQQSCFEGIDMNVQKAKIKNKRRVYRKEVTKVYKKWY